MEIASEPTSAEAPIRSFLFEGSPGEVARIVEDFCRRLFPSLPESYVQDRIGFVVKPELFVSEAKGRLVAFKVGYQNSATTFFSWLGGVDEDFRRLGLASRLAALQHARCRALGISAIETRTRADNPLMLIVNLRSGFQVVGVEADPYGRFVVLQRRSLD